MSFKIKKEALVIIVFLFVLNIPLINSQCPTGGCGDNVCGGNICVREECGWVGENPYSCWCAEFGVENCNNCPQDCGSCCVGNTGASCNCGPFGCGGSIQCDGSCSGSVPCSPSTGQQCNCGPCGCGGTIRCDGSCSGGNPTPSNYGQGCGNCGTINCAGNCVNQGPCSSGQTKNIGSCGNCGTLQQTCQSNCQYGAAQCINQGSCSPGQTETQTQNCGAGNCGTQSSTRTCSSSCSWGSWSAWSSCTLKSGNACFDGSTQCSGSRYQNCNSGCQWQNSGTDADGDGTDAQCGDSLCDNNPNFVNSNRQCDAGQTQCSGGRYQTCSSCQWQNSGTDADKDGVDAQCGDSQCDNSPSVFDSTKTPTENACADGLDNDCDLKTDCNDSDCDGSITGTVKNQNEQHVSGADVSAKKDLTTIKASTTNQQGNYLISPIACGSYSLVASHPDYAPQTKSNVAVAPQQQTTSNFGGEESGTSLVLGTSCEADCTFAADNIIHASCDGKNGCSFYDSVSKAACDNSQPGWVRDYNSTHYVTCASGSPQAKIEIQASVSCASGTLVKVTRIVVYQGKPVKLVVVACG